MSVSSRARLPRNFLRFLTGVTLLFASASYATNTFDRRWVAEWNHLGNGMPVTATINLQDGVGTFRNRVLHSEREDNCIKYEMPAPVVWRRDLAHYLLVIRRSGVLQGCGTLAMKIEHQADGSTRGGVDEWSPREVDEALGLQRRLGKRQQLIVSACRSRRISTASVPVAFSSWPGLPTNPQKTLTSGADFWRSVPTKTSQFAAARPLMAASSRRHAAQVCCSKASAMRRMRRRWCASHRSRSRPPAQPARRPCRPHPARCHAV